jgi:hypothetical protein
LLLPLCHCYWYSATLALISRFSLVVLSLHLRAILADFYNLICCFSGGYLIAGGSWLMGVISGGVMGTRQGKARQTGGV